ncbi:CACTA en-spm transposon protein [Cucumis melo var. makuwa]|uniref:CACTA en-spm transposon protein n=1 Tax=Cucumis melo var. makuwa TaxID=1194695 RepID=A0A5D3CR32_CUCMM|nr:CACTA en-spm transposon protein [Cucumis melo var. makuwa]TYK14397.1 CACTA en-spm transposon protein [Cucumis melo var. makuwa]
MVRQESLVVIYNELIMASMYPRRFALCVGDGVRHKDHSRCSSGASRKNRKNERGKKKGRDEPPCVLSPSLVVVALVAIRPCRRLPPCIKTDAMFLEFEDDLHNLAEGSSSVGDNAVSLLELERHVAVNGRISMTIAPGTEKPISSHVVRFSQAIGVCVRKTFPICCLKWVDDGREYIEVVKGDLQRFFVFDFNDQAVNRVTVTDTSKSTATPRRLVPTHQTSNHERTRLLDRSSFTIIAEGQSHFYNDSMSSLRKKESRSTIWSCFGKHTFDLGHSYCRPQRTRIIKCWNSSPSLPQRVVSHSLGMRYALRCWVDDQAIQKAWLGTQAEGLQDDEC